MIEGGAGERGSVQHSPRVDDELEHETRSMVQGAAVEARSQEARTQEGPADGEPEPDARIAGDRPSKSPMLAAADVELRSELARHLQPGRFPASRPEVLAMAQELHAPDPVIELLNRLPEGRYDTIGEVWLALGGATEPARGETSENRSAGDTQSPRADERSSIPVERLVTTVVSGIGTALQTGVAIGGGIVGWVRRRISR